MTELRQNVCADINTDNFLITLNGFLFCVVSYSDVDAICFNDDKQFEKMGIDFYEQSRLEEEIDREFSEFCNKKGYIFDSKLAETRGGSPLTKPLSYMDAKEFAYIASKLVQHFIDWHKKEN